MSPVPGSCIFVFCACYKNVTGSRLKTTNLRLGDCSANSSSGSLGEPTPSLFQKEGVTAVIMIRNYKFGCIFVYPLNVKSEAITS